MRIVSTGYTITSSFNDPQQWLRRISFHTGILEELAKDHQVNSIELINYNGIKEQNGVKYHFLKFKDSKLYFPRRLHSYIKELDPDVVLMNGFIFPLQLIQLRLTFGSKVKIFVINHAEKPSTGPRRTLQRMADRFVEIYFFTSAESGKEWVERGIIRSESRIKEVMEVSSSFTVMDKNKACKITGANGKPVFLFVGNLIARKDPLTVLKAFAEFIKYQPAAKLYVIYDTEELKKDVIKLLEEKTCLQKAVKLVGFVAHEEMQYWHNSADFIISGSHYEGSGIAVCEAMSCGCIPVLTNIPSFRMMTGRGSCGYLYEPGDADELLKILLRTGDLNMEDEKKKTLQMFEKELSFKAIAKKMNETFASLNLK